MRRILTFSIVILMSLSAVSIAAEIAIDRVRALKLVRWIRGEIAECKTGFQQLASLDSQFTEEVRLAKSDLGGVRDGLGMIAAQTDILTSIGKTVERVFPPLAILGTVLGGVAWNERRNRKKAEKKLADSGKV